MRGERLALTQVDIGTSDLSPGAPHDEVVQLCGIDTEGRIALQVWFDIEDIDAAVDELDAAHARFGEAHSPTRRLENVAHKVFERYLAHFAAREWDALAEVMANDISTDDRRRTVNAGIRHGRDAEIANLRAAADVGITYFTSVVIAARGERLILARVSGGEGGGSGEFLNEVLGVVEINSHNQIAAIVLFDLEDFEAAIEELDARYLAGEAAAHARTWSVITRAYAALNRRELPPTTPGWVNIDHRRGTSFASGEMPALLDAVWNLTTDLSNSIEAVHRLNDLAAVVTNASHETSREGFDAEWRVITVVTVEGDMLNRCEVFDEADVDAAIARFDQLSRPAPRLENAASQAVERYVAHFAARDWDALAKVMADNIVTDDRRRGANAGIRHGRDAEVVNLRVSADAGVTYMTSVVIAVRGERLVLARASGRYGGPGEFLTDVLAVAEINSGNQIAAIVVFDLDDFDDAIAELDARYLSGEAAAHAGTWSVIAGAFVAHNRREVAATTPDVVNIDHRQVAAFAPGEGIDYIRAGWDLDQTLNIYIETAHRVNDLGAVFTWAGHGTSHEGFAAEWRGVNLMTVNGEMVSRSEVFDEADLDTAIARFEQVSQPACRLENAASQAAERLRTCFVARDWDDLAEILAEDMLADDRRRIVGTGIRRGRHANVADIRAGADVGTEDITSTIIATRGERIALDLARFSASDRQPEGLNVELLRIVEVDTDNRMTCCLMFDVDDLEAAIAELDARYLAGEAAPHAHTWSVITRGCAALNQRELFPTTPDWVNIDHRSGIAFTPGDLTAYIRSAWNLLSDGGFYIETAHRLSDLGAVVTWRGYATSQEGVDVEFRGINLLSVEGDLINRCELFDEADLDAALARFDQLSRPARRLENAASRVAERFWSCFASRDWDAITEVSAEDISVDDRRRTANAGIRHGRDAEIEDLQAAANVGFTNLAPTVVAARGERLILSRTQATGRDPEAVRVEVLHVIEIDADDRIAAVVVFDLDDIDAAIAELDARYLAGEAAPHAHTWSIVAGTYASISRHELPAM
jgi:hypothetical protein